MIPTFVFGFPTGKEQGDYLAVDLGASISYVSPTPSFSLTHFIFHEGGTNLRVCLVNVQGDGKFEITQSKYRLTEEQKHDEGQKLFDFCAESLKTFIDSNLADEMKPGDVLPLGFTV
jgi:hexokinase